MLSLNPHLTTGHKLKIIGKVKSCLPSIRYKAYGDTDKHPAVQLDTNRDQIGKHARKNLVRMGSQQLGPCCFVSRSSHTSPATTQTSSCLTPGNLFLLLSSVGHGESSMAWSFCFELFGKNYIWKPRRAGSSPMKWAGQGSHMQQLHLPTFRSVTILKADHTSENLRRKRDKNLIMRETTDSEIKETALA